MSLRWGALLGLVASACLWGGAQGSVEVVRDPGILGFADRIERFYGALEGRSAALFHTFQDPEFRAFFEQEEEFVDYYASLASELRNANFRHARPLHVQVREFRFEGTDRAQVEVTLIGEHYRSLLFWDVRIHRTDTWERHRSEWFVSPERL